MILRSWRSVPLILTFVLLIICTFIMARALVSLVSGEPFIPSQPITYPDNERPLQALYLLESESQRDGWTADRAARAARIWQGLGNPASAVAYGEMALSLGGGDRQSLAEAYIEMGDWSRANDVLDRLIMTTDEPSTIAWAALQLSLIRAGSHPVEALALLERAIQTEPGYASSMSLLLDTLTVTSNPTRIGMTLMQMDLWTQAERAFSYAPDDPLALAFIGFIRETQGKNGGAYIRAALNLSPDDAQVRLVEGLYYRQRGELQTSLNAFARAVEIDPNDAAIYAELGTAYQLLGDPVTAEQWLQQAIDLSGGDPRYEAMLDQVRTEELDFGRALGLDLAAMPLMPTPTNTDQP